MQWEVMLKDHHEAYIGWGLYVMQKAEERGVSEAAWDLAAHLGEHVVPGVGPAAV